MSNSNYNLEDEVLQGFYEILLRNLYDLEPDDKLKLKKSVFELKKLLSRMNIHVSNAPPPNPTSGTLWFDTSELCLKVFVPNTWLYVVKERKTFLQLEDTPDTYESCSNKVLVVSEDEKGIVFKDVSQVVSTTSFTGEFHNVTDVYVNHNLNATIINYKVFDDNGYEFIPNEVRIVDENNVIINMIHPMSGRYIIFKY